MKVIKSETIFYTSIQIKQIVEYKIRSKVNTANRRFQESRISIHDIIVLLEKYKFRCIYCDDVLKPNTWQLDHFYSKATGGRNKHDNLAPSCKWCNMMKGALDGYAFINKCKLVSENNFFKKILNQDVFNHKEKTEKQLIDMEKRYNKIYK
ncbi:MAG: HNH endonuclease signature motif containing protein [Bacteroidota bacterium]